MEIKEVSEIGEKVLKDRSAILIGLSVKNSYFNAKNLEKLILWSKDNAKKVFIMIPDKPAVFTLMSFGYSEDKARTKARLESNRLQNKCNKIINDHNLGNIEIVTWSDIESNPQYIERLQNIMQLFKENDTFRADVEDTTKEVLKNNSTTLDETQALKIGVNFLFQELAFIAYADKILRVKEIAYLYHSTMPVFKEIVNGKYLFDVTGVGYITAE